MTYEDDIVRLTVLTMYPEDSGQYTCVAKNQAGTDSTQTELLVEGDKSEIWIYLKMCAAESPLVYINYDNNLR